MRKLRVAVTGVGGAAGQSIMKALSLSTLAVDVLPVDVHPLAAGLYRVNPGAVLPRLEVDSSIPVWERWLTENRVDALLPGSDYDLLPLSRVRDDWLRRGVCHAVVSDHELVQACRDKARTCERLQAAGLPAPDSAWDLTVEAAVAWARERRFPVILKPRDGSASRNMHVVRDEEELRFLYPRTPRPMVQEYLGDEARPEEFTCAVFVQNDGAPLDAFMARRDLSSGTTYRAEVNEWPDIRRLLLDLGAALKPRGPMNVQLRKTTRGPVPFELNIRCSGTTALRAHFGYNEPEMMLRHFVLGERLPMPRVRQGFVFRYWNEIFLDGVTVEDLRAGGVKGSGTVLPWP